MAWTPAQLIRMHVVDVEEFIVPQLQKKRTHRHPNYIARAPVFISNPRRTCTEGNPIEFKSKWSTVRCYKSTLTMLDEAVIIWLFNHEGTFHGSTREFTEALGMAFKKDGSGKSVEESIGMLSTAEVGISTIYRKTPFQFKGTICEAQGTTDEFSISLRDEFINMTPYFEIDSDIYSKLSDTGKRLYGFLYCNSVEFINELDDIRAVVAPLSRPNNFRAEVIRQLELMKELNALRFYEIRGSRLRYIRVQTDLERRSQ